MNQELLKKLAMVLYDNYCMAVGGAAFNGDKLPSSEDFFSDQSKQKQIDGWMSAAASAVTFAETCPEIITDGLLRRSADKLTVISDILSLIGQQGKMYYGKQLEVISYLRNKNIEPVKEIIAITKGMNIDHCLVQDFDKPTWAIIL